MRTMGAAKAKTQLLALLEDVAEKREPIVVTKNGRAMARIMPMPLLEQDPIFGFYQGKLEIVGDIISSIYADEESEEFLERSAAQLQ